MGDDWGLEDKLLRRNIPGRYKQWDRDSDEEEGRATQRNDDESEEESEEEADEPPMPTPTSVPEAMRRRAGAKGQLAQYRYFKQMQYQERMAEKAEREAAMLRVAAGTVSVDSDEDDVEDYEDDFVKSYSEMRIRDIVARPTFGALRRDVSKDQYLSAIDKTDSRVVVVVHLKDPRLPPCRRLDALLELVAQRQIGTLFLSMTVDEAGQSFDPEVMPVVALYQNGRVIDTLFNVTSQLSHDDLNDLDTLIRTAIAPHLV